VLRIVSMIASPPMRVARSMTAISAGLLIARMSSRIGDRFRVT
jgi:hypothetical protein